MCSLFGTGTFGVSTLFSTPIDNPISGTLYSNSYHHFVLQSSLTPVLKSTSTTMKILQLIQTAQ